MRDAGLKLNFCSVFDAETFFNPHNLIFKESTSTSAY